MDQPAQRHVAGIARGLLAAGLALLMVACGATPPSPRFASTRADTAFQRQIDRLGLPIDLPATGKVVIVNIPAFELIAVEDGAPVLRTRVIVGAPRTPTPIRDSWTRAVTFRPSWRPTPEMIASGEYEDRVWPPGPANPLGLAAVRLEPGLLVYLHDTNQRHLFARDDRALSHGCIRVQRWDELIAWLIDRDLAIVHAWAEGTVSFDVATERVPVLIRYMLAFPGEDGKVATYPDVYRTLVASGADGSPGCGRG